ncbi:MAG TPA: gephyrin-like molybdotransferase Glp [Methanospirillum sp.]|nr:gephyrin-like molybdotransferase Glp [Methanospirillum sp.]
MADPAPETPTPSSGYFFDVVPIEEAVRIVRSISHQTGTETIPIDDADGRTLSEPVFAPADIPGFDRSWRDGYAVIAESTLSASETNPVPLQCIGSITMGTPALVTVPPGHCMYIPTGGHLPEGTDAVVMVEYTEQIGDTVFIKRPVVIGENIIRRDEDFKAADLIYQAGWIVRPQDIGVLASVGKTRITVRKNPVIGIISTGTELVPAEAIPRPGEVREVNSHLISVFCRRQGAIPVRYGIIRDNPDELSATITRAAEECDAVIVSGGSSKDRHDITAETISALGEVYVHGISIAPGKPTIIGKIHDIPIIGLPGHPASTFMVLSLVVIHLVQAMKGSPCQRIFKRRVTMATSVQSEQGREQYIRVRIDGNSATPVLGKSGLMNTLAWSDGIIRIPAGDEGYETGDEVEVMLW